MNTSTIPIPTTGSNRSSECVCNGNACNEKECATDDTHHGLNIRGSNLVLESEQTEMNRTDGSDDRH